MNTFIRGLHRFSFVVQTASAAAWAYMFMDNPHWHALFGFIWCIAFAAYSYHFLRSEKKGIEA